MGQRWEKQCKKCDQRVEEKDKDRYNIGVRCTNFMNTDTDDGCGIYCWYVLKIQKCPVCNGALNAWVRGTRCCTECNWTFTTLDTIDGDRR